MSDEQLIEYIKQFPVLYNTSLPEYRDHNVRNNAWEEIAEQMNAPVDDLRDKWGKLRNCFTNALKRRRKKGQSSRDVVPWKFEKSMKFLLPYVKIKKTFKRSSTNDDDINEEDFAQETTLHFSDDSTSSPFPVIRTPTPTDSRPLISCTPARSSHKNDNIFFKEMVDVLNASNDLRQKRERELDEVDYFFLSMSKQIKKLPKLDQAEIKFQLHKLVHDCEIKMLNNEERDLETKIISNKLKRYDEHDNQ